MLAERMGRANRHHAGVAEKVASPRFDRPAAEAEPIEGADIAIEFCIARVAAERPAEIARDVRIGVECSKRVAVMLAPGAQAQALRFDDQAIRRQLAAIAILALVADVLDRNHVLALGGIEHDDALRRAAGDADAIDRAADQLPGIGHQHDLVCFLDRE